MFAFLVERRNNLKQSKQTRMTGNELKTGTPFAKTRSDNGRKSGCTFNFAFYSFFYAFRFIEFAQFRVG